MVTGMDNITYENRLKRLNLHSLERHRVRRDLIEVFQWYRGINNGDIDKLLMVSKQDSMRSNELKLESVDLIKK